MQDYAEALRWLRKAAAQGDASAMGSLGVMYANALGVGQDYAAAVSWWLKAAEQGEVTSQAHLEARITSVKVYRKTIVRPRSGFSLRPIRVTPTRNICSASCMRVATVCRRMLLRRRTGTARRLLKATMRPARKLSR